MWYSDNFRDFGVKEWVSGNEKVLKSLKVDSVDELWLKWLEMSVYRVWWVSCLCISVYIYVWAYTCQIRTWLWSIYIPKLYANEDINERDVKEGGGSDDGGWDWCCCLYKNRKI